MDDSKDAAARAGQNLWRFHGLSFVMIENTLELGDLEPVVTSIQPEFADIRIVRRVAGPMAGGIAPEAALLAVFAAVAIPFLAEVGKDSYKLFRVGLFAIYKKAKTVANGRGYAPLGIEIQHAAQEDGHLAVDDNRPNIYFVFQPGMEADEFERAIDALVMQHPAVPLTPGAWVVVLEWSADGGEWRERYRE